MGAKKEKTKTISIDERGRVTLPPEARKGVETFVLEILKDGTLKLIPQETVSLTDAALLKSLKKSVAQAQLGEVEDVPDEWID